MDNFKQNLIPLLKYTAIIGTSISFGTSFYIHFVQIPVKSIIARDIETLLLEWRETNARSLAIKRCFTWTGLTSGVIVYILSERGQTRSMWLAGALSIIAGLPWTELTLLADPDIQRLQENDIVVNKGEPWVREKIALWNQRHVFRTITMGLGVGFMCYAKL